MAETRHLNIPKLAWQKFLAGKEEPQKSLWTGIDFPSKADGGSVIDPADIAAKELGDLQRNWKIRIKSETSSLTFLKHALLSKRSALRVSHF